MRARLTPAGEVPSLPASRIPSHPLLIQLPRACCKSGLIQTSPIKGPEMDSFPQPGLLGFPRLLRYFLGLTQRQQEGLREMVPHPARHLPLPLHSHPPLHLLPPLLHPLHLPLDEHPHHTLPLCSGNGDKNELVVSWLLPCTAQAPGWRARQGW